MSETGEAKSTEPIRDPIEKMDMSEDLEKVRNLFRSKGYACKSSSGAGEVWERSLGGQPGYRWILLTDQGGRLRAELRNPVNHPLTSVSPAFAPDVEIAMGQYGVA